MDIQRTLKPAAGPMAAIALLGLLGPEAWATASAAPTTGIAGLATGVQGQLAGVATLMVYTAYVAGIAFALTGILKFKAHKDQPTQVPLSQPIVLLLLSACLLFLPSILNVAGGTLFGTSTAQGGSIQFTGNLTPQ